MYLIATMFFFLVGGMFALSLRTELFTREAGLHVGGDLQPGRSRCTARSWCSCSSSRAIPAALGNFVLPIMLGAKDVAFPQAEPAVSFYIYCIGAIFAALDAAHRRRSTPAGPSTRRTRTTTEHRGHHRRRCGVFILGFSSILTGLNFIVTVHKLRAPGMTWSACRCSSGRIYATAIIQVLATPVLAITLLLLIIERALQHRHLRPGARRRPGAVPALLLVLHPPGRLHHDPARAWAIITELIAVHSPQAHLRLHGDRALARSRSRSSASSCGATTCSSPGSREFAGDRSSRS